MERQKVSRRGRREAPERQEGWNMRRGAVVPTHSWIGGNTPRKKIQKSTLKSRIICTFANWNHEMVSSSVSSRQGFRLGAIIATYMGLDR